MAAALESPIDINIASWNDGATPKLQNIPILVNITHTIGDILQSHGFNVEQETVFYMEWAVGKESTPKGLGMKPGETLGILLKSSFHSDPELLQEKLAVVRQSKSNDSYDSYDLKRYSSVIWASAK